MDTPPTPESHQIARLREFNRFWTRSIGALDEGHLHTDYSLTECRVLYEIDRADRGAAVTALRDTLGIDAGRLSRILARLADDGLITRHRDPGDGRRQTVAATPAGRRVQRRHDALADDSVRALLDRAEPALRPAALHAADTLRDAFDPVPRTRTVEIRDARPGDLGWAVMANAESYAREYGFNAGYEALVARIAADYAAEHDPEREALWIAEVDGERAGCIMCVRRDAHTARLRLLLVDSRARGLGVGGRLVRRCVDFARDRGYRELHLWTTSLLASARRIYQAEGFTLRHEAPHRDFGRDLTGQDWSLDL